MTETVIVEPEGRFRRGLFVMLVAMAVLVAGSFLYARQSASSAVHAEARSNRLIGQLETLTAQMRADDEDARQRASVATRERQQQAARLEQLQRFTASLLAHSTDPALRIAVRDAERAGILAPSAVATAVPRPTATKRPARGSDGRPAPASPRPSVRPSRAPSPSPRPSASVVPGPLPTTVSVCLPAPVPCVRVG